MTLAFCVLSSGVDPSFSPDIFNSMSVLPSLKACLDLSAEYLILSDVQRKVGGSHFIGCFSHIGWREIESPVQPPSLVGSGLPALAAEKMQSSPDLFHCKMENGNSSAGIDWDQRSLGRGLD